MNANETFSFADSQRHIIETIEAKREFLGMPKAELARRMGIDPVTMGTILRGQRALQADEAMRLCALLNIDPRTLVSPELQRLHAKLWQKRS